MYKLTALLTSLLDTFVIVVGIARKAKELICKLFKLNSKVLNKHSSLVALQYRHVGTNGVLKISVF